MTREELEKLSDRELDALVARNVMGWLTYPGRPQWGWPPETRGPSGEPGVEVPAYSTDPAASRELRRKMEAEGWNWRLEREGNVEYWFTLYKGRVERSCVTAQETEERAVAIAALLAVGEGE